MAHKPKGSEDCTEEKSDPIIVLEEQGKKMIFLNKQRKKIKVTIVDGCEITDGIRCDYLVKNPKSDEFFVELKGTDIEHACKQLEASIKILSVSPNLKHSFVIATRVAPAINPTIQILMSRFRKKLNSKLFVKGRQFSFNL